MPVHQRHADRGVGIEHLLGGDDLDLVGIDVEAELAQRDLAHRVVDLLDQLESPLRPVEQGAHVALALGELLARVVANWNCLPQAAALSAENSSWNTGKMSSGDATRRMAKFRRRRATSE